MPRLDASFSPLALPADRVRKSLGMHCLVSWKLEWGWDELLLTVCNKLGRPEVATFVTQWFPNSSKTNTDNQYVIFFYWQTRRLQGGIICSFVFSYWRATKTALLLPLASCDHPALWISLWRTTTHSVTHCTAMRKQPVREPTDWQQQTRSLEWYKWGQQLGHWTFSAAQIRSKD
jgi:hypothetical protein